MSIYDEITQAIPLDQLAAQLGVSPDEAQQAVNAVLPALVGGLDANAADPAGAGSLLNALGQHDGSLVDGGVDLSQVDTAQGEAIAGHIFGDNQGAVTDQLGAMQLSGGNLGGSLVRKLIPILAPIVLSYLAKKLQERMGGAAGSAGSGGSTASDSAGSAGSDSAGSAGSDSAGSAAGQGPAGGAVLPGASDSAGSGATSGGPGSLQDMLNEVLGGAAGSAGSAGAAADGSTSSDGSVAPSSPAAPGGGMDAGSIINILGGLLGGGSR